MKSLISMHDMHIVLEEIRPFHNGEKYEAKVLSVYADVNGEWSKLPLPKGLIYWALCRGKTQEEATRGAELETNRKISELREV